MSHNESEKAIPEKEQQKIEWQNILYNNEIGQNTMVIHWNIKQLYTLDFEENTATENYSNN